MDYKEKLRLAKEALDSGSYDKKTIEYLFPELKESEDESIRKRIIEFLSTPFVKKGMSECALSTWIAWLEKQGEQKPADKIEPKFKIGDIISDGFSQLTVESVQEEYYIVTTEEIENDAHIVNWIIYFKDQDKWKLVNYKD